MKIDNAFLQFATAALAMICLVVVSVWGQGDNTNIVSVLSAVLGGGVWGGIQSKMNQARNKKPAQSGPGE